MAVGLLRTGHDAACVAKAAGIVERQGGRLVRLVDDLLDVARISRGKMSLNIASIDQAT